METCPNINNQAPLIYNMYFPTKVLEPFVAFYYILNLNKKDYQKVISEYCLPSGCAHMGFQAAGNIYVVQKNEKQISPRFYTSGQQTGYYHIHSDSDLLNLYGVTFTPTGLWHFFKMDMPTITNRSVETASLFNHSLQKFSDQFNAASGETSKIKLIEKLLIKKFRTTVPQLNIIDSAIHLINKSSGCCKMKDIIAKLGISERYFQKNFKKIVGITPSAYKRIVRFNCMFSKIGLDASIDCKALMAHFNYYDFAHFSKDFKKYCGTAPSQFEIAKFRFLKALIASGSFGNTPRA